MQNKLFLLSISLVLILAVPDESLYAQYRIDGWVFGGGGGIVTGENVVITSTAGIPLAGSTRNDSFVLGSGFWHQFGSSFITSIDIPYAELPDRYALMQNFPNPFNPSTTIQFALPAAGEVQLVVYDMLGRKVTTLVDDYKEAGYYEVVFEAGQLSSGVYLYRIRTHVPSGVDFVETKRLMLLK